MEASWSWGLGRDWVGEEGSRQFGVVYTLPTREHRVVSQLYVGWGLGARWRELRLTECPSYFKIALFNHPQLSFKEVALFCRG